MHIILWQSNDRAIDSELLLSDHVSRRHITSEQVVELVVHAPGITGYLLHPRHSKNLYIIF